MSIVITGTFDIECEGWDKYVIGGAYDGDSYVSYKSPDILLDYLLERGGTWWGHYAGGYDMLAMLATHAARRGMSLGLRDEKGRQSKVKTEYEVKCFMAGSRITCAAFGRRMMLRDSYAIAPVSLEKFARIAGLEKTKPDLSCNCGEKCGGYCSIRRDMSRESYRKVDGYMENDCEILFKALSEWVDFLRTNFGEPKGTIGATAFGFTHQKHAKWDNSSVYSFVSKGTNGGRTEVFLRESPAGSSERWRERERIGDLDGLKIPFQHGGWHDDISSAYVDALRLPMPVGQAKEAMYQIPKSATYYVAEAQVKVPDCHIPPFPIKRDNRLFYPTGEFFGTWNKTELESAVADNKASIVKIGRVVYWESMDTPYLDFCNRVWAARDAAGKNTPKGKLIKQMSVSVCGKLMQRPEIMEVVFSQQPKLGWKELDRNGQWWYRESFKIANCAHVQHAGLMTAHVRVRVRRRLDVAGHSAVYCDTDGTLTEIFIPEGIGMQLGEWMPSGAEEGYDGRYYDMEAVAPKLYRYREKQSEFRAKGFSLGEAKNKSEVEKRFNRIIRGEEIEITKGVYPLLKALRQREKLFEKRNETRQFHRDAKWCGGRLKVGIRETRPPTIHEVHERIRRKES